MHQYRRRFFLQLSAAVVGAGLAAASVSAQAPAAADNLQQYDVELVLFRLVNPTGTPEEWAAVEARLLGAPPTAIDPAAPPPTSTLPPEITNFPALDAARFKLQAVATALQRNKAYEVLGHVGWTQPGYPLEAAPKVDLATYLPPGSAVSGTIALARGRYLHLTSNLIYQSPQGPRYVLREQRRMQRSGEKHYLDHPQFGVIAVVTPRG